MDKNKTTFDIIGFTGDKTLYYGASIEMPDIILEAGNYKKHTEVNIPVWVNNLYGCRNSNCRNGNSEEIGNGFFPFIARYPIGKSGTFDPKGLAIFLLSDSTFKPGLNGQHFFF